MLNMQIEMSKNRNVRFELREGQNRINTMALIHDQLYQSENLAKIELEDYIRNLVSYVLDTFRVLLQIFGKKAEQDRNMIVFIRFNEHQRAELE